MGWLAKLPPVKRQRLCIEIFEPARLPLPAQCRTMVKRCAHGFGEWPPIMPRVGQMQMPDLIHLIAGRNGPFAQLAKIGEFQIFSDDTLREVS